MAHAWGDPAAYAVSFGPLCAQTVDAVVAACGPPGPRAFLDVGCGTGSLAAAARDAGWRVVGLDADPAMAVASGSALPDLGIGVGALPRLPVADDACGAVGANFVVNHTDDPRAAVAELARVCRSGGRVALTIWPERLIAVNALWNDVMVAAGVAPPPRRSLPPGLDVDRDLPGLRTLLADAGLREVEVREVPVELRVVPADLWRAADGGIATIGAVYRAQPPGGRLAMRSAYDTITAQRLTDGLLVLPGAALLGAGTAE